MTKGIKNKITRLVLVVALTALLLLFLFSTASILIIRNSSVETNKSLGENAAEDSANALTWQSQQSLTLAAQSLALQVDDKMANFKSYSQQIEQYITNILENENNYKPQEFLTTDEPKKVVLQYFNNYGEVTQQAKLIANAAFLMENIVEQNSFITAAYFAGADKSFIVANRPSGDVGDSGMVKDSDMTQKVWYTLAEKQGATSFTDVFDDTEGRGKVISCSTPIYINKILVGVVGIGGLLSDVSNIIDNASLHFNGFAFVINEKNNTIIGGEHDDLAPLIEQIDFEYSGMVATYNNKDVFISYSIMPLLKWTVCTVYEVDAVLAKSYALQAKINELSLESQKRIDQTIMGTIFTFVGIVILAGIAIVAIGKAFSTKFTEPILSLNKSIDDINGKNIKYQNHIRTGDEIENLGESFEKMTIQISDYIENLALVTAEKERIGAELTIATQIQASMLPCIFPPFPDRKEFDIFAAMRPAKEVGGDFYDFFLVDDNRLAVIVADVSGKGVPAALFMVIAKTLIKNAAQMGKSTAEIFTDTNAQLCEGNDTGLFVTAWLGILEISSGKLSYSNAGHNPPLIKRKDGKYDFLRSKAGFVLAGMEGIKYAQFQTYLGKGDELFLYTDGVTEATNARIELLGEERLVKCLNKSKDISAKTVIENVELEIENFVAGELQFDDITMLCLQINDNMDYIEVDAVMENLDTLQEFAEKEIKSETVPQKTRFQIAVIIEEWFINIVKYAHKGRGGLMKMGCKFSGDTLELQFIDSGEMFNPIGVVADTTSGLDERKIGGLGIHMIKKSVDKMEYAYENNHNILTLTKYIEN